MGNIKKFLKYLLPIIVLPMLYGYASPMYSMVANTLGIDAIRARNAITILNRDFFGILSLMPIVVVSVAALLAENGKAKAAKTLHLVGILVYSTTLVMFAAVCIFMPRYWLHFIGIPESGFDMGISCARAFILSVLPVAAIAALVSQLSGKHSFILTMVLGGSVIVLGIFISVGLVRMFDLGIVGIAVADGLAYSAAYVMPFLMVPVKRYANVLAPNAAFVNE